MATSKRVGDKPQIHSSLTVFKGEEQRSWGELSSCDTFFNIFYLAALDLSCGTQDLRCGLRALVP